MGYARYIALLISVASAVPATASCAAEVYVSQVSGPGSRAAATAASQNDPVYIRQMPSSARPLVATGVPRGAKTKFVQSKLLVQDNIASAATSKTAAIVPYAPGKSYSLPSVAGGVDAILTSQDQATTAPSVGQGVMNL